MTVKLPDEQELILVNRNTGQEYELDILYDPKSARWEKVFATNLVNMLKLLGDEKIKVVAYLIKNKDYLNVVNCTMKEVADDTGVSTKTVSRVLSQLRKAGYLKKVRNSKWRFSPHIMRHGKASIGAAIIRLYDEVD